jgi:regulator of sigma E protease
VFEVLPTVIRTPLAFVIVLGVLVFIHELGHYLAARWRGVHVEVFSIGFGTKLLSWTDRHDTEWRVCILPLGGYVKMHGMEQPEDITDEVRAAWRPGQTFHEKPVLSRMIAVAAGPVANFVLAAVLFAALFAVSGRPVTEPVVSSVVPGSAAAAAGLQAGDRIESISGRKIGDFEDIVGIVGGSAGRALDIAVERDGKTVSLTATPAAQSGGGVLGIMGGKVIYRPVSAIEAIPAGIGQTWTVAAQTLQGIGQMLTGRRGTDELGGPLRIAQLSGQVAEMGAASLISFIAVLSVNLGLLNLFPIPVLDGGHLVFFVIEALRGKPLSTRAQEMGMRAGLALLIGLFVFATWNDLSRLGLFGWIGKLTG